MVGKTVNDHLGTEFPSVTALCEYYGIGRSNFHQRISRGWSLEDALTTPARPSPLKSNLSKKEREKNYFSKYYSENKERLNAYSREYKEAHREEINLQAKDYRMRNYEKIRDYQKQYRDNPVNKEKAKAYQEAYRAKKRKEKMEKEKKMKATELLFSTLLKAFDEFFNEEEKFVGCLNDEEHKEFLKMRNRIDEVFMQKINLKETEKEHKAEKEALMYVPCLDDNDDDGIGANIKKRHHQEMEL